MTGENVPLQLHDLEFIAENDHGWRFGVGRVGDRWVGFGYESEAASRSRAAFASEGLPTEPGFLCVFPEISEGHQLGVPDRERAILLTGAIAQDPESAYGGVDRWHVGPELRGDPERFRCASCERVGCDGRECAEFEGEDYP